jgi:alpha-amylase
MKKLLLLASTLLLLSCINSSEDILKDSFITPVEIKDWRDEIIYQILVDRFEDGDVNNNFNVDKTAMAKYHGGDWQGIIDKLDYIQDLGVTTIWISPVVQNVEEDAGFGSYHGYWTQDFLKVNFHFGSLTDLRRLVDACHKKDIKVILDVVTNHVGQLFYYDINGNGEPDDTLMGGGITSPLTRITEWDPDYDSDGVQGLTSLGESGPAKVIWVDMPEINRMPPNPVQFFNDDWFHKRGRVTVWGREAEACNEIGLDGNNANTFGTPCYDFIREQEVYGDFPGGLKDLATERSDVTQALIEVFKYWIKVADFDGFRIDTIKHVDYPFWKTFNRAIRDYAKNELGKDNFYIFGEAFTGLDWLLASYTGDDMFDGVFYFSQKFQVFDNIFKNGNATNGLETLFNERSAGSSGQPGYAQTGNEFGPTDESKEHLLSPRSMLVNFMDNHDVPRYLFDIKDKPNPLESFHSALVFLLTWDGIPCIYYGTEQQFSGGNDPQNREDMFMDRFQPVNPDTQEKYKPFNRENKTFKIIKTLNGLRKTYAPLRRGYVLIKWVTTVRSDENSLDVGGFPLNPDRGIMAFERVYNSEVVLVVINTSDTLTSYTHSYSNSIMSTSFTSGTQLKNVYCGDHVCETGDSADPLGGTITAGVNGAVDITLGPRQAVILVPVN